MLQAGLLLLQRGSSLISRLCALEGYRGKCGIGKNPWFGFRILAAFFANVPYQGLNFLCRSHTCSLDSG